jgi:hypothetical protein
LTWVAFSCQPQTTFSQKNLPLRCFDKMSVGEDVTSVRLG